MAFNFYFSGASFNSIHAKYLLENNGCLLLSQLLNRSAINKCIDYFKSNIKKIDSTYHKIYFQNKVILFEQIIEINQL